MIAGQKLRAFRERRNVSQSAIAGRLGVTRNAVADMEGRSVGIGPAERYLNAVGDAHADANGFARVLYRLRVVATAESVDQEVVDGSIGELRDLVS